MNRTSYDLVSCNRTSCDRTEITEDDLRPYELCFDFTEDNLQSEGPSKNDTDFNTHGAEFNQSGDASRRIRIYE